MEGKMGPDIPKSRVEEIMIEFAALTGLSPAGEAPRRYLWTDAFAVCNFLELFRQTNEDRYRKLALNLVDQVHNVLGRHRDDDSRTGWISGLGEQAGGKHPTKGGLRIGKELNECRSDDPYDERLEWGRDGQYYHYLTKWMHALNRVYRAIGDSIYNQWAIELAKAVHPRFTYGPSSGGRKLMYWKMSIDLSHPLVPSMGHHDPLDGLVTYLELQASAGKVSRTAERLDLNSEITDMASMCEGKSWETDDPLGLGELLSTAYKLAQLVINEGTEQAALLDVLMASSLTGLQLYERNNPLKHPADYRLAFRELGLSIGLHAVERLPGLIERVPGDANLTMRLQARTESLLRYVPLAGIIEQFWLHAPNSRAESWTAHRDINMVMLATSLAPNGYLSI
jgi:hypothetical protein